MPKLDQKYLMESDEEYLRLDMKTNEQAVEKQAGWAGIQAGMRVADLGCGSGKTSAVLRRLVQPGGSVIGIDFAENRIRLAEEHYAGDGLQFQCRDIRQPLDDLGSFDFIWVRFVLEYYLAEGFAIVKNIEKMLRPGGILCLVDLDHNCLSHYGLSDRLNRTLQALLLELQNKANFDPYAGRKLYSFLYDLNYLDIRVEVAGHHVIYGDLKEADSFIRSPEGDIAVLIAKHPCIVNRAAREQAATTRPGMPAPGQQAAARPGLPAPLTGPLSSKQAAQSAGAPGSAPSP